MKLDECMMRADAFNLHVDPVRTEMTGMQQISISHICYLDKSKLKWIITDKNSSQVFSTDERKPERVIVNESFREDSESEIIYKSISTNEEKFAIDET